MCIELTSRRLWALPRKYTVKLAEADLGRNDFGEKIRDVSTFLIPTPKTNTKEENKGTVTLLSTSFYLFPNLKCIVQFYENELQF